MTILFKCLVSFVSATFAGKLICVQHVLFRYDRILEQTSENYYEPFINMTNAFPLLF